jgi:hypothetical protein
VEIYLDDPGYEIDVYFTTDLRTMIQVWMGDLSLRTAQDSGRLKIVGPSVLLRNIKAWFPLYLYADIRPEKTGVAESIGRQYRKNQNAEHETGFAPFLLNSAKPVPGRNFSERMEPVNGSLGHELAH